MLMKSLSAIFVAVKGVFSQPDGLGLGEGRAFEIRQFKYSTKADRSKNVQLLPSALLLPNPC